MFSTVLALCFLLKIISRTNYFAPRNEETKIEAESVVFMKK